jgi:putative transposase
MNFDTSHVYHVFNQGNNRSRVFFNRDNYLFFLKKIRKHIVPFADVLAWCLMPNHFHVLIYIKEYESVDLIKTNGGIYSGPNNSIFRLNSPLSKSIGNMLSSYTRAVNLQNNLSGSLFRAKTKALCLTKIDGVTKAWLNNQGVTMINTQIQESQYPMVCYNYILKNPVYSALVKNNADGEFSSYPDVIGTRKGTLISHKRIEELGLVLLEDGLNR